MQTKLPTPLDAEQARAVMPGYIEYGLLSQNSLIMLQQLMSNIFVPLLNVKSISTNEGSTHVGTLPTFMAYHLNIESSSKIQSLMK